MVSKHSYLFCALVLFLLLAVDGLSPADDTGPLEILKQAASIFDVVSEWNGAIDKLTDSEVKAQLERRVYRVHKDMVLLQREKQDLIDTLSEETLDKGHLEEDVQALEEGVEKLKHAMDEVSSELAEQPGFDGQAAKDEIDRDVNEKVELLIEARMDANENPSKVKSDLQAAQDRLIRAEGVVADCLRKLKHD